MKMQYRRNPRLFKVKYLLTLAFASISVAGCSTTTVESWTTVEGSVADRVDVRPAADFSIYRRLYPESLEIYYPTAAGTPDPDDLARIRRVFSVAFLAQIGDDYEIVDKPGRDVLQVRASLIDLRTNKTGSSVDVGRRLQEIVRPGHLTFLMELIDSQSSRTLARAADEEKPDSELAVDIEDDDWVAIEAAAARWAEMFRSFLDEQLDQS